MKKISSILCIFIIFLSLTACSASGTNEREEMDAAEMQKGGTNAESEGTDVEEGQTSEIDQERDEADMSAPQTIEINIKVGDRVFLAKLYDNQTTQALVELLPLSIAMEDLHRNEKFYYLPESLPTDSESPGVINAGEIMLYGDNCLVFFYEKFSTSYNYTRLGYIEDVERFAQDAGDGEVNVVLDLAGNNK